MSTNLKLGNLVTPKGASLIFGAEATDNFLDIKTTNDETYQPYTIVIAEEDEEETIPAEQISYFAGTGDNVLTSTTAQDAITEVNQKINISNTTQLHEYIIQPSSWTSFTLEGKIYYGVAVTWLMDTIPAEQDIQASFIKTRTVLDWMSENKVVKALLYLYDNHQLVLEKKSFSCLILLDVKNAPTSVITFKVFTEPVTHFYDKLETITYNSKTYMMVDSIGGAGGSGGSFIVTYGETPIDEVISAVEDNLNVTMLVNGSYAPLTKADLSNRQFVFSLDFPDAANPTAIGSRNIYVLNDAGYSFSTHSNFSADLYKTSSTPNTADVGYIRPIRVSTDLPTEADGNVGDLWVVIGG